MTDDLTMVKRWKRRAIVTWVLGALLIFLAFAAAFVMAATDDTDNIALSRNQVVRAADGTRTWRGTFWNHSDSLYEQLDAVILFLDRDGKPVGQARGGADRLDPGEVFHLAAPLPASATRMQVYQLRWSREGGPRGALGPYRSWPFGYVMDTQCGEVRTKLGSCEEQREVR
ncbi:MAG: FxLYD domain-containing protein [Pseudomonadota bacterium]